MTGDVSLCCGKKAFKAHKTILAAKSEVFEAMFKQTGTLEDCTGKVKIEDAKPKVLEEFLRCIYLNEQSFTKKPVESLQELLIIADKYIFSSLKHICEESLGANLCTSNVGDMALFAEKYAALHLKKSVSHFVALNFTKIIRSNRSQFDILPDEIAKCALLQLGK